MTYISKRLQLLGDKLFCFNLDDQKELLWKQDGKEYGGVPYIEQDIIDKYKSIIKTIIFRTKQGRYFRINFDDFVKYKKGIIIDYQNYYYVEKDKWEFRDIKIDEDNTENKEMINDIDEIAKIYCGEIIDKSSNLNI